MLSVLAHAPAVLKELSEAELKTALRITPGWKLLESDALHVSARRLHPRCPLDEGQSLGCFATCGPASATFCRLPGRC